MSPERKVFCAIPFLSFQYVHRPWLVEGDAAIAAIDACDCRLDLKQSLASEAHVQACVIVVL